MCGQVHAATKFMCHVLDTYYITSAHYILHYIISAHYILSILGYAGLHDCNLYVETGTNRALHNIYILLYRTILSPSGCVHYVACMGGQVHAAKIYMARTGHILYHL